MKLRSKSNILRYKYDTCVCHLFLRIIRRISIRNIDLSVRFPKGKREALAGENSESAHLYLSRAREKVVKVFGERHLTVIRATGGPPARGLKDAINLYSSATEKKKKLGTAELRTSVCEKYRALREKTLFSHHLLFFISSERKLDTISIF